MISNILQLVNMKKDTVKFILKVLELVGLILFLGFAVASIVKEFV